MGYKVTRLQSDTLSHCHFVTRATRRRAKKFPKEENYGVTSQLRRAALSVPTNIVEGVGRQGRGELKQFINIALGSLAETEYLLEFCFRLRYLDNEGYNKLEDLRKDIGGLLWNFHKSIATL